MRSLCGRPSPHSKRDLRNIDFKKYMIIVPSVDLADLFVRAKRFMTLEESFSRGAKGQ